MSRPADIYQGFYHAKVQNKKSYVDISDILASSQVVIEVVKELKDSQSTRMEFQGLVNDLETFNQALFQVVHYPHSPRMTA
jgi:hypothetical protein